MTSEKIITVFGSSRPKESDSDYAEARELGRALAARGFAVCSGGYGGGMEAVSRGAKEAGGKNYRLTGGFFGAESNAWGEGEERIETWHGALFRVALVGDRRR